jgi:hypothetical protein
MVMPRPPRRPPFTLVAALLAAFFLTVIGASVGYLLANQAENQRRAAPAPPAATGEPAPTSPGTEPGPTTAGPTTGPTTPPAVSPTEPVATTPAAEPCPPVTQRAALAAGSTGGLTVRLYVRTARSEVWICRDRASRLWYQGRLLAQPFTAATSNSSIFLGDVATETGGYVATNYDPAGDTRYHVSRTVLVLQFVDPSGAEKSRRVEAVVASRP